MVGKRVVSVLAGLTLAGSLIGVGASSAAGTAGSLDPTFGSGGKVLTNTGVAPSDVVLAGNGDIVVSLGFGTSFGAVRYLPNGKLDQTFGNGGIAQATISVGGQIPFVNGEGLVVQPDGKVIVVAQIQSPPGSFPDQFGVARFNANGSLDTSFGNRGHVETQVLPNPPNNVLEIPRAVLLQNDGKILVGGSAAQFTYRSQTTTGVVVRYNANGTLDATFGTGGIARSTSLGDVASVGLDSAGNVFVLPAFAELTSAGRFDPSLTPAPIIASSHGGLYAFRPNGQALTARSVAVVRHDVDAQAQRFIPTGALDGTFSNLPFDFTGAEGPGSDYAAAIAPASSGRVLIGGGANSGGFALARLNATGSLDGTFGNRGVVTTTFQGNDSVGALVVQPDGKIVAVGFSGNNSTGEVDTALARYLG